MLKKVTPKKRKGKFVIWFKPMPDHRLPGGYWGWAGTVNEAIYGRFQNHDDKMVRVLSWSEALNSYQDFDRSGWKCDIIQIG